MTTETQSRFLTLSTGDARLPELLGGNVTGEPGVRPLLLPLLNTAPSREIVNDEWVFELVPLERIQKPSWLMVWIRALRPDTLVLSVAPILATLGWLMFGAGEVSLTVSHVILTIVGILALHASVNLFNDYHDHVRGWDRVREHGGARVISRGWLRASDVHRAAWAAFAIAVTAGAPVVLANMSSGLLLALFALVAALEFAVSRIGLKYRGFAEITAWFMFGPLLTGGFAWAMTGKLMTGALVLGGLFGSLALLCLHLKNFERILIDGRAGLKTWPVRAGFDASKTFTYFCFGLISLSMAFVLVIVDPVPERFLPMMVLALGMGTLATRVNSLESPLAGRMRGLQSAALRLAWMNLAAFALGDLIRFFGGFTGLVS